MAKKKCKVCKKEFSIPGLPRAIICSVECMKRFEEKQKNWN